MKAQDFIKESIPINVEEIQRKQHIHNLIENAWQKKLIEQKYNYFNHYNNEKDTLIIK